MKIKGSQTLFQLNGNAGLLPVYVAGFLFIIVNGFYIYKGSWWILPLALAPAVLWLALFHRLQLFMIIVFLTPLSIGLSRFSGNLPFDVSLPTEPLILALMFFLVLNITWRGSPDRGLLYHPLSLAIIFYLLWLLVTTLTSTMPVVSAKFLASRVWFIFVFYFFAVRVFRDPENIRRFLWCYSGGLLLVVIYTLYNHSGYGFFSQRAAHWVVRPFYNDHTAYGAALAMFLPVVWVLAARGEKRWTAAVLLVLFMAALVFSYSRAAWLSTGAAFGLWLVIKLKIRFHTLVVFALSSVVIIFMLRHDIVREMEKNTQDSSADFREHIRSVTNITTDASNLERINRWKSAVAMFRERPVLGWGPGTYMFNYAPFQFSYDRTIISTNFGEGGDAHSEYLGPLAETGLPGMLGFMAIAAISLLTAFRLLVRLEKPGDRLIVTGVLLGMTTYLVHGVLNNFLHSDKAAVPFWGFAAMLVALDLYGKKRGEKAAEGRLSQTQSPGW